MALYDVIGSTYGRSRRADPGLVRCLAGQLAVAPTGRYLDLACGTGSYTVALGSLGGEWHGVDVSATMLHQARDRSTAISWLQADASALPYPGRMFDGAICTLAIHHFADLERPFAEVRRVLRSGPLVVFTGVAEQMRHYWLCHYFPTMMARSIEKMPTGAHIRSSLARAGFLPVTSSAWHVTDELEDLFLYAGKDRPHLYLDPAVRANISSFAALCPAHELERGVARLASDLGTGEFSAVRAAYDTGGGDYALFVARIEGRELGGCE